MEWVPSYPDHVVGEWTTDDIEGLELSSREHLLTFAFSALDLEFFGIVGHVSETEFMDVAPGLLCCTKAIVGKCVAKPATGGVQAALDVCQHQAWTLCYVMVENASLGWNEIYHRAEEGKLVKRTHEICPTMDFAAFFGQSDYPLRVREARQEPPIQ